MFKSVRVLIIDDDPNKADAVVASLLRLAQGPIAVSTHIADSLSTAAEALNGQIFDLVVLDLMLPFVSGQQAEVNAGLELLRQLRRRGGPHQNVAVIGLSAFPEEANSAVDKFSAAGVVLVPYDEGGRWVGAIEHALSDAIARLPEVVPANFVVMTALEMEREAFSFTALELLDKAVVNGLNVQFVRLGALTGVLVRCRQMGLAAAILDTATALRTFEPGVVAMSGICAGRSSEVKLGQLVLASTSWEYQAGKWAADGFQIAPYQVPMKPETRARAEIVLNDRGLLTALEADLAFDVRRPAVRCMPLSAPFASGSAVVANEEKLSHIFAQHRKMAAFDMEVFGVYFSCHESPKQIKHFFAIKSVVDLADQAKDDQLHTYGAIVSARATVSILRALLVR